MKKKKGREKERDGEAALKSTDQIEFSSLLVMLDGGERLLLTDPVRCPFFLSRYEELTIAEKK